MDFELYRGDCLDVMKDIPDGSVDMVLTDPPYGTTACKWDSIIPLEPMWDQLKRIIKPNGAIVMTAAQPFTSVLVCSNLKMFKYEWVWVKTNCTGFANAKKQPLRQSESVLVFYKSQPTYNPQGITSLKSPKKRTKETGDVMGRTGFKDGYEQTVTNYPKNVLNVQSERGTVHPTQKPVALMEYLIKTYTNEGETVLDFTMGSGTTGVACGNLGRKFIGIELDRDYYHIARKRISEAYKTKAP